MRREDDDDAVGAGVAEAVRPDDVDGEFLKAGHPAFDPMPADFPRRVSEASRCSPQDLAHLHASACGYHGDAMRNVSRQRHRLARCRDAAKRRAAEVRSACREVGASKIEDEVLLDEHHTKLREAQLVHERVLDVLVGQEKFLANSMVILSRQVTVRLMTQKLEGEVLRMPDRGRAGGGK